MSVRYLPIRFGSFYFFSCGIGGVIYFLSVWLEKRGLNFEEIGLVMSMTAISKIVFGPVAASLSDRGINSCRIMIILSVIAIVGTLMLFPHTNVFFYMIAVLLTTGGVYSGTPLGENMTVTAIKNKMIKTDYSRIRVVGTLSYVLFAVLTGYCVKKYTAFPDIVIYGVLFFVVAMLAVSVFMVDVRDLKEIKSNRAKFKTLFKQKDFIIVITIQILYSASFGMQHGLGPAHWVSIGIDENIVGLLTVPAIFSETVFFLAAKRYFDGMSYQTMLLVSSFTTMIRWLIVGFTSDPLIIGCAFLLHGVNYCFIHLGMMNYIKDVIPENLSTRAQAAYAILAGGVCSGLSMVFYGCVYPYCGGKTFLFAAGFSLIATVLSLRLKKSRQETKRRVDVKTE